jgi:hypothetical protein
MTPSLEQWMIPQPRLGYVHSTAFLAPGDELADNTKYVVEGQTTICQDAFVWCQMVMMQRV